MYWDDSSQMEVADYPRDRKLSMERYAIYSTMGNLLTFKDLEFQLIFPHDSPLKLAGIVE